MSNQKLDLQAVLSACAEQMKKDISAHTGRDIQWKETEYAWPVQTEAIDPEESASARIRRQTERNIMFAARYGMSRPYVLPQAALKPARVPPHANRCDSEGVERWVWTSGQSKVPEPAPQRRTSLYYHVQHAIQSMVRR